MAVVDFLWIEQNHVARRAAMKLPAAEKVLTPGQRDAKGIFFMGMRVVTEILNSRLQHRERRHMMTFEELKPAGVTHADSPHET